MENKDKLVNKIRDNLEKDTVSDIDNISTRDCESEDYTGFSLTITGNSVPIRPVLETVEKIDDWKIESIGMYSDIPTDDESEGKQYKYGITAFCAYVGEEVQNDIFTPN